MISRHLRISTILIVAGLILTSAGCATNQFQTSTQPLAQDTRVTAIQIYSFLDFREATLGKSFITETSRALAQALDKRGVRSKELLFNDSPVRTEAVVDWTDEGRGRTRSRVLIDDVIAAHKREEDALAPTHRLIIFPTQVTQIQVSSRFDVRWDLVDARSGNRVWSTTSSTNRLNWVSSNGFAIARAKEFVEALMAEMEKSKVVGAAAAN